MLINYTNKELDLLARIMRAEAQTEGNLGMLMVGNVVVNRVIADCYTFKNINSIEDAIYQPNQFVGTNSSLFMLHQQLKKKFSQTYFKRRVLLSSYTFFMVLCTRKQ